jgi:hypothetical protein
MRVHLLFDINDFHILKKNLVLLQRLILVYIQLLAYSILRGIFFFEKYCSNKKSKMMDVFLSLDKICIKLESI